MSNWQFTEQHYELLAQKIDETKAEAVSSKTATEKLRTDMNGRIGKLESWRNRLIGAWGVLSIILMIFGKKIGLW